MWGKRGRAKRRPGQRAPRRTRRHGLAPGPTIAGGQDPGAVVLGAGGHDGGDGGQGSGPFECPAGRPPYQAAVEVADRGGPEQGHGPPQLCFVPAQQAGHAFGAARGQRPQGRPPDQGGPRPECHRLGHVGDAAHAAVHVDLRPPGDRVDDLRQDVGGRRRVGELAGAVVRHHDGRRSRLDAPHGVVGALHALDHDRQRAQPGEPADVVGGQRRLELVGDDGHEPTLARAVGAVAGQIGQGQVVGEADSRPPLAQPQSRHRGIDRQDQRAIAVGGGPAAPARPSGCARAGCRPASSAARPVRPRQRPRAGRWRATRGSSARPRRRHLGPWPPRPRRGPALESPSAPPRPAIRTGVPSRVVSVQTLACRPAPAGGAASGPRRPHCPPGGVRRRPRPSSRRRPSRRWRGGRLARGPPARGR